MRKSFWFTVPGRVQSTNGSDDGRHQSQLVIWGWSPDTQLSILVFQLLTLVFNLELKAMDWCLPLVRLAHLPHLYNPPGGDIQRFFSLGNSRSGKVANIKQYSELPPQFSEKWFFKQSNLSNKIWQQIANTLSYWFLKLFYIENFTVL